MRYPAILTPDDNGALVIEAPDAPGVLSFGANETDALAMGQDALLTMLDHLMSEGQDIPAPGEPAPEQPCIELPAMAVVKLAIYSAMRERGVSQIQLAALLKTDPKSVRRLLNLWHNSRWDHLEAALAVLGLKVTAQVMEAA